MLRDNSGVSSTNQRTLSMWMSFCSRRPRTTMCGGLMFTMIGVIGGVMCYLKYKKKVLLWSNVLFEIC
ncbi:hypothetical protein AHAS_Ahas11G0146600 [Arachis hypogaea]